MRYDQADIFLVPLLDGGFGVGQVIVPEAHPLCALSLRKQDRGTAATPLAAAEVIALHRIDPAHLNEAEWPIIGFEQIPPLSRFDRLNAIEAEPLDPVIAEALLNAWHGLYPWDGFPDREFFDGLLRHGVTRPASARTRGQLA